MGVKLCLLFSLGCQSKQAGDERDLPWDISFVDLSHLSFPKHVHHQGFSQMRKRAYLDCKSTVW